MQVTTEQQILDTAKRIQEQGKDWHFHILTPNCQLNDSDRFALILENVSDKESWVNYSDAAAMKVGQQLVKLLHGDDVVAQDGEESVGNPSPEVDRLLSKAKKLNSRGKFWHHHMLFPGCMFNSYQEKFVIVFEDQEAGELIESISDEEPKTDLKHIEGLFYAQNND